MNNYASLAKYLWSFAKSVVGCWGTARPQAENLELARHSQHRKEPNSLPSCTENFRSLNALKI